MSPLAAAGAAVASAAAGAAVASAAAGAAVASAAAGAVVAAGALVGTVAGGGVAVPPHALSNSASNTSRAVNRLIDLIVAFLPWYA